MISLEKKHSISLIPKVGHLHTFIPHLSGFYLRIFRGVERLIGMLGIDGSISHVLIGGLFVGCDVIGFEVSKIMLIRCINLSFTKTTTLSECIVILL